MKTALASVIYKQSKEYFEDLISSVSSQTDLDFDFLVINDNYDETLLTELVFPPNVILVNKEPEKLSPAELRVEMLKEAKSRGYDLLIISDADDTFSKEKVKRYKEAFAFDDGAAFYYNDLVKADGTSIFDELPSRVMDARPISQSNFLGMSTTAINMKKLSMDFIDSLKNGLCNIFDWYLYTRILMDVGYGNYVSGAETIYRLHDCNLAGVAQDTVREKVIKLEHYNRLAKDYPYFAKLRNDLENFDIESIKKNVGRHGYWWSTILMEDTYDIN